MPYLLGVMISLLLPFVALWLWWLCFAWWLQRVPPNSKSMEHAEAMGSPRPPIELVDARGNVRQEWAADLVQQRLRGIDSQRR